MRTRLHLSSKRLLPLMAVGALVWCLGAGGTPAYGGMAPSVHLTFETELLSLDLSGGPVPLPLARDPLNSLLDSTEGYGWVDSTVGVSLSSERLPSPGEASLWRASSRSSRAGSTWC